MFVVRRDKMGRLIELMVGLGNAPALDIEWWLFFDWDLLTEEERFVLFQKRSPALEAVKKLRAAFG